MDYEGALKIFDAVEGVQGRKPRVVLVSAVDVRDPDTPPPPHYVRPIMYAPLAPFTNSLTAQDEADIEKSKNGWAAIGTYMKYKYLADKNLSQRTAFKWVILRPGTLINDPGTGKGTIGRTHISKSQISVRTSISSNLINWAKSILDRGTM